MNLLEKINQKKFEKKITETTNDLITLNHLYSTENYPTEIEKENFVELYKKFKKEICKSINKEMKKLLFISSIILLASCTPKDDAIAEVPCTTVIATEHRYTYVTPAGSTVVDWAERPGSAQHYRNDCQEVNTYRLSGEYRFVTSATTYYIREDRYVIRRK